MKNIIKVGKINKNIKYYELKGENYIDDKEYSYEYKIVKNIKDVKRAVGNIYEYLPTVNDGQIEYNELRIFDQYSKIIFKFYNKSRINITTKFGNKQNIIELDLATVISQNLVEELANIVLANA